MGRKQLYVYLLSCTGLITALFLILFNSDWSVLRYSLVDVDVAQVAWNTDHFSYCIRNFKNPWYTEALFQPQGEGLLKHSYTQFYGFINLFVNNVPLAVNLGVYLSCVLGGIGFFLLGRRFALSGLQCIALALFAIFNFFTLNKYGIHLHLLCFWPLPFAMLAWMDIKGFNFGHPLNRKRLFQFLVLLLIAWFCDFHAVLYILSFVALHLIYVYGRVLLSRLNIRMPMRVLLMVLILVSAHLFSKALFNGGFSKNSGIWGSADIRLLFVPGADGRFLAGNFSAFSHILNFENYVFMGYMSGFIFIGALIYKFAYRINGFAAYFLFMIVAYLMIIFPDTRYNEEHLFFTPFSFTHYIPGLDEMRNPGRFMEMLFIFVPLFVFHIINNCHIRLGLLKTIMPLLAFGVSVLEFFPAKTKTYDVNRRIKNAYVNAIDLSGKSILNIPFCRGDGKQAFGIHNQDDYFFQIANRCKIWGGYIARMSKRSVEECKSDPLLTSILRVQASEKEISEPMPANLSMRPELIVIDKQAAKNHALLTEWLISAGMKKLFEDDRYSGFAF